MSPYTQTVLLKQWPILQKGTNVNKLVHENGEEDIIIDFKYFSLLKKCSCCFVYIFVLILGNAFKCACQPYTGTPARHLGIIPILAPVLLKSELLYLLNLQPCQNNPQVISWQKTMHPPIALILRTKRRNPNLIPS